MTIIVLVVGRRFVADRHPFVLFVALLLQLDELWLKGLLKLNKVQKGQRLGTKLLFLRSLLYA
jgi:hypothetical protein